MKYLLLSFFLLFAFAAHSQSTVINKSDSTGYHFSVTNGWVVKMTPLQILADNELRIYLEKRISNKSSIEIFGSYFYPDYSLADYYRVEVLDLGYLRFARKIGIGYKMYNKRHFLNTTSIELFYKYSERISEANDYTGYHTYDRYDYFRTPCLQYTKGKRLQTKLFVFDFFVGAGLRINFEKSVSTPIIPSDKVQIIDWGFDKNLGLSGFIPTIQCGVNIGLKIK